MVAKPCGFELVCSDELAVIFLYCKMSCKICYLYSNSSELFSFKVVGFWCLFYFFFSLFDFIQFWEQFVCAYCRQLPDAWCHLGLSYSSMSCELSICFFLSFLGACSVPDARFEIPLLFYLRNENDTVVILLNSDAIIS